MNKGFAIQSRLTSARRVRVKSEAEDKVLTSYTVNLCGEFHFSKQPYAFPVTNQQFLGNAAAWLRRVCG
jgi:hypothetical protein